MHHRTRFPPALRLLALVLLVLVVGCPKLRLGEVTIKPGSTSPTAFTLQATVIVEETDDTEGPDQSRQSGKGVLGIHLPAGWTATAARMRAPDEGTDRALWAAPQAAGAYSESFPATGGVWWAFSSATAEIAKGAHTYTVEIDVVVPKKTRGGQLGVSASALTDDLKELAAPSGFEVTIKGKAVTLVAAKGGLGALSSPPPVVDDTSKAPSGG